MIQQNTISMNLAIGGEEGKVKIFDVKNYGSSATGSKAPLRNYPAHSSAVHTVRNFYKQFTNILWKF